MDGYGGGVEDLEPLGANPTGNAVFDASQYAFFGNDIGEEVELGGLDDEEDYPAPLEYGEEEFQLEREEGDAFGSTSEIDELSTTFSKLNKVISGPANAGVSGDWGSRQSSSVVEWSQDPDIPGWVDRRNFDAEVFHESKNWSSHPYPSSSARVMESNSLHRTSSYPEQQPQPHPMQQQIQRHQHSSEPILIPKSSSLTSYPPPGGGISPQASLSPNIPYRPGVHQMPIPSPNLSSFSNPQLQLNALPHGSQFSGNFPQRPTHHGPPLNSQLQNQRMNLSGSGHRTGVPNNVPPQQLSHQNWLVPPQMTPQHMQQTRMQHPYNQQPVGHLGGFPSQMLSPHLSPPMMNNIEMIDLPDSRDPRAAISMVRSRQGVIRYPHQRSDIGGLRGDGGWLRSKYMTTYEIENIVRMQLAATHTNDPYVEDYYHQACLARKSSGAKLRHHFCPVNVRDSFSKPHASNEPHAFLQVDALGRVSFSSIRRPRPLLEVDSTNSSTSESIESKLPEKPLEQEPMLAARVTIEDGLCLLLDVDDIDRFLQFNQPPDGGAELRQKRQVLLEGLASSLQLVDPLGINGQTVNLAPKDDFIFLRIVSLPKGKKLLLKYLQLLPPGELSRVVSMAIFRNLRFLFGTISSDPGVCSTTINLAETVSSLVNRMDLKSLAACLASVVCSSEHPPLRPIGSAYGDGASVILKSVLDRATEILTGSRAAACNCSPANRAFWQASFDAFFNMLTKYCFNKYDSVVQSYLAQSSLDPISVGSDMAKAIAREMPVELLRASLPHTSELQKKVLLEFAQRSMPVTGQSAAVSGNS